MAILGSFWNIDCSLCKMEVMKTQSSIWGAGHAHQADLSTCFVSCIAFAKVLTPLLCQCCLVMLSQSFGRSRNDFEMGTSFAVTHYFCWACTASHDLNAWRRNKYMRTACYYCTPFSLRMILFQQGFICCMECLQHIYILCEIICIYCKWMDWYSIFGNATVWKIVNANFGGSVPILCNRKSSFWVKH